MQFCGNSFCNGWVHYHKRTHTHTNIYTYIHPHYSQSSGTVFFLECSICRLVVWLFVLRWLWSPIWKAIYYAKQRRSEWIRCWLKVWVQCRERQMRCSRWTKGERRMARALTTFNQTKICCWSGKGGKDGNVAWVKKYTNTENALKKHSKVGLASLTGLIFGLHTNLVAIAIAISS